MKRFNSINKFRFLIIIFLIIFLVQAAYVIIFANSLNSITALQHDRIITIVALFIFIELVLGLYIYFYIDKSLSYIFDPLKNVFDELENGKLQISLPYQFRNKPLDQLSIPIRNMLANLQQFNQEKKNKIKEFKDRLSFIMKNIDDAIIIINENFQIVYVNDIAKHLLGIISDEDYPSLMDFHFEGGVLKYFKEVLSKKILLPERKIYFPKIKKHVTLRNGIVHNTEGSFKGIVFLITDITLDKLEKTNTKSKNSS